MEEVILGNLQDKYRRATMTRQEVATELSLSLRTIDNMILKGDVLPKPLKIGKGKNAPVRFNLIDISNFIIDAFDNTEKMEYMRHFEFMEHKKNHQKQEK